MRYSLKFFEYFIALSSAYTILIANIVPYVYDDSYKKQEKNNVSARTPAIRRTQYVHIGQRIPHSWWHQLRVRTSTNSTYVCTTYVQSVCILGKKYRRLLLILRFREREWERRGEGEQKTKIVHRRLWNSHFITFIYELPVVHLYFFYCLSVLNDWNEENFIFRVKDFKENCRMFVY